MALNTVILDYPATHGRNGSPPASLLSMPLGPGTALDHLCGVVGAAGGARVWLVRDSGPAAFIDEAATERFGLTLHQVRRDGFSRRLAAMEPSDLLLVIDPRYWPAGGLELDVVLQTTAGYPGAMHAVAMGSDTTDVCERVQCDESGHVRRIRRFYSGVTEIDRLQGRFVYCVVPVAAMEGLELQPPGELRVALAAKGVLSRDMPLRSDLIDLTDEQGYLALSEQVMLDVAGRPVPPAYSRLSAGVLVGRGALVHESARLIGPIVLQAGVRVDRDATIIGPCVIGEDSSVGRDAVIAQAVVPSGARVAAGATVRHCISPKVVETAVRGGGGRVFLSCEPAGARDSGDRVAPELEEVRTTRGAFLAVKRCVDLTLTITAIVLLFPVLVVAAILIKLDSRGPLFFVHDREGIGGKPFPCLKFRTMRQDAHVFQRSLYRDSMVDGPHFKLRNDPRVTRVGRVLRKTNIDELPQLFNVLLGHMSLVGPRPSPFRENQYCIPWRRARLSVRPGITGLWQICRQYGADSGFQQWIYYDMNYVRHMSPWLDMKIIGATVFALLFGREVPLSWLIPEQRAAGERGMRPGAQGGPVFELLDGQPVGS